MYHPDDLENRSYSKKYLSTSTYWYKVENSRYTSALLLMFSFIGLVIVEIIDGHFPLDKLDAFRIWINERQNSLIDSIQSKEWNTRIISISSY